MMMTPMSQPGYDVKVMISKLISFSRFGQHLRPPARDPSRTSNESQSERVGVDKGGHLLRLVADRLAPHPGVLELGDQLLVQPVAEVLDGRGICMEHDGRTVVRDLTLGLVKRVSGTQLGEK